MVREKIQNGLYRYRGYVILRTNTGWSVRHHLKGEEILSGKTLTEAEQNINTKEHKKAHKLLGNQSLHL